ncbi:Putative membrane bound O-acyl transferase [Clostridium neonatale]|nr:MBOAT family O-acyltransferase [Clostridium neonatale]CAG9714836.1 Putative membrane bound O-acyl transferase [Clostridium neonatale]
MVFSNLLFMYVFFPFTLIIYYFSPRKMRNFVILLVSLLFYSWGEPIYINLMLASILIGYIGTIFIDKYKEDKEKSRCILVTTIVIILSTLIFFKYYGFLIDNINLIFGLNLKIRTLPLPLGISFYTFKLISYVVDVYTRKVKVQKNFINFATYVSMFPQLLSGPIVQYSTIENQLTNRKESIQKFSDGVEKFISGLGKKVIIANNIGLIWDQVIGNSISEISILTAWIGIISFTFQIYFDFSGYSDMAIGLGKMFGFDFYKNFNYPYISKSITDFWRRWHISLGTWFKDYIYIPLGGNRTGKAKQIRNIFIVWLITGLWHGASWNYIIWGLYFGIILFIEKSGFLKILKKLPGLIRNIYTMFLVIIGWVFFEFTNVKDAFTYIRAMFGANTTGWYDSLSLYLLGTNKTFFILAFICSTPIIGVFIKLFKRNRIGKIITIIFYILIVIIATAYLVGASYNPFLYFKF